MIKIFFSALFLFLLLSYSDSHAQNYSIVGTWERVSTDEDVAGIRVTVIEQEEDNYIGYFVALTQPMIRKCYEIREVKWYNIIKKPSGLYRMKDIYKSEKDCSAYYIDKYIRFTNDSTINITIMGIPNNTYDNYQVWSRVKEK